VEVIPQTAKTGNGIALSCGKAEFLPDYDVMKKERRTYGLLIFAWTLVYLIMLGVFGFFMMGAEFGTEERKIYQTWFTYSNYFGITGALLIGLLWFFKAPKKRKNKTTILERRTID